MIETKRLRNVTSYGLPCPLYLDLFLHLGPLDLEALPPFLDPNVTFLASFIDFAILCGF